MCFWATAALAACNTRTRVHYVSADGRSRRGDPYYYPERLQSRASSIFGPSIQTSAAGFPYRFVFPANHPALSGSMYSQYVQNPHQPEPAAYSAEDLFGPQPMVKQHPLSDLKHRQHQQQQQQQNQQQQIGYDSSMAKMQYDFLGGGGGGKIQPQQQPSATYHHHLIKQPKHYQSYELAPNSLQQPLHQSPYPSTPSSMGQPIMLLIPSSGQPGAPYQTLVLVPSSTSPSPLPAPISMFPGFHQQVQHQHGPPGQQFVQQSGGFITTHPRGPPLVAGFPSGLGGGGFGGGLGLGGGVAGLGKFSGAQLFHRSHEPLPKHLNHQQHQHKASSSPSSMPLLQQPTSYQGSGSTHVSHTTAAGSAAQQPLEDKVGHGTGTSGEKSEDRDDSGSDGNSGSTETKSEEKSPEFGDKTTVKPIKRIVVT